MTKNTGLTITPCFYIIYWKLILKGAGNLKVLFIGGTGLIGTACGERLLKDPNVDITLLHRGNSAPAYSGAEEIIADANDKEALIKTVNGRHFDVVVDWIAFAPDQIKRDAEIFSGKIGQYIFISSASAYQKPVSHYRITESTPLVNPYWEYSANKAKCEQAVIESGLPYTIVRPSHTYGTGRLPFAISANDGWTPLKRMLENKPVIVHGDGTSLWTITHNTDFARAFAGLVGQPKALGHSFHITSDEALTWNNIIKTVGFALGVEPEIIHLPSVLIEDRFPQLKGHLLGDKAESVIFDNSKIKEFVPGFKAKVSFADGVRRVLAYWENREKPVDTEYEKMMDDMVELAKRVYERNW